MKANEAVKAMLGERGVSQSEAGRRLGKSRGHVGSDTHGYVVKGKPLGMTVDTLLEYADMLGYALSLVPLEGGIPLHIDEKSR